VICILKCIREARQKETKNEKRILLALFFRLLGCFDYYFALCCAFSDSAQFGSWHVRSTREREVAFATLPDSNALAFYFYEAALRALVRSFEPSDDLNVSLADCSTVSGA